MIVVLFVLGFLAATLPKWWRLLAVLVALLVVSDIAHALAYEIPRPGANPTKLLQFLGGSFVSIAVWAAAILTIVALVRRRIEALYGIVFVGLLVALIGGATDVSALWNSQLPDAGPTWLTRVEVALALGLGAGLVVGALVRMLRSRAHHEAEADGKWLSLLVVGLSDAELARIVPELDADEVLAVALRELAVRAAPVADAFSDGALVFVVGDPGDPGDPVTWSIAVDEDDATRTLNATRGRVAPTAAEIHAPFAVMLQLLAGLGSPRRRDRTIARDDRRRRCARRTDRALPARERPDHSCGGGSGVRFLNSSRRASTLRARRVRKPSTANMTMPNPTRTMPPIVVTDGPLDVLGRFGGATPA